MAWKKNIMNCGEQTVRYLIVFPRGCFIRIRRTVITICISPLLLLCQVNVLMTVHSPQAGAELNKYEGCCRKYYFSYQQGALVVGGLIRFSLDLFLEPSKADSLLLV